MAKRRREADSLHVETMERDKKIAECTNQNRIAETESVGTENEIRKLETEIETLHMDLEAAKKASIWTFLEMQASHIVVFSN